MYNHEFSQDQEEKKQTIQTLLQDNIGLVYKVVSRFCVSRFDRDDLIQAGLMGLEYAILHYDEKKGFKLSTYAIPFIIGNIKKELKNIHQDTIVLKESILDGTDNLSVLKTMDYSENIIIQLAILEDDEQEIYHLKFQKNYTEKKIAKIFGVNQSTISRKIKKIKEKLSKGKN